MIVYPNYPVDDEGLPTFTASGGKADIECYTDECNSLVEVTLMQGRNQSIQEIPAVRRHLEEQIQCSPEKTNFSIFIAPTIHADSQFMIEFSKHQYQIDIVPYTIDGFIDRVERTNDIIDLLQPEVE